MSPWIGVWAWVNYIGRGDLIANARGHPELLFRRFRKGCLAQAHEGLAGYWIQHMTCNFLDLAFGPWVHGSNMAFGSMFRSDCSLQAQPKVFKIAFRLCSQGCCVLELYYRAATPSPSSAPDTRQKDRPNRKPVQFPTGRYRKDS